jgi:hypothetical protein
VPEGGPERPLIPCLRLADVRQVETADAKLTNNPKVRQRAFCGLWRAVASNHRIEDRERDLFIADDPSQPIHFMHQGPITPDVADRRHPFAPEHLLQAAAMRDRVELPIEERDAFALRL